MKEKIEKVLKEYKVAFLIIGIIILGVLIGIIILKSNTEKNECKNISKNYKIVFVSNANINVDSIEICEKCENVKELPTMTQENKEFEGWYYDVLFTDKVDIDKIKRKCNIR